MSERWLPVPGWEGYYSVSDHGRVRSDLRTVINRNAKTMTVRERILRPGRAQSGHLHVMLYRDGRGTTAKVHQLVLLAFVGECPANSEGLHWDDNPGNNFLTNLRYGTKSDNRRDSVRNGRHHQAKKAQCVHGHKFTIANTIVRSNGTRNCRACAYKRAANYRSRTANEKEAA